MERAYGLFSPAKRLPRADLRTDLRGILASLEGGLESGASQKGSIGEPAEKWSVLPPSFPTAAFSLATGEALRVAQLELFRGKGGEAFVGPYFWAAFQLSGDGGGWREIQ